MEERTPLLVVIWLLLPTLLGFVLCQVEEHEELFALRRYWKTTWGVKSRCKGWPGSVDSLREVHKTTSPALFLFLGTTADRLRICSAKTDMVCQHWRFKLFSSLHWALKSVDVHVFLCLNLRANCLVTFLGKLFILLLLLPLSVFDLLWVLSQTRMIWSVVRNSSIWAQLAGEINCTFVFFTVIIMTVPLTDAALFIGQLTLICFVN